MNFDSQFFSQIQDLLETMTVTSRQEIIPEASLEEDLGLNLDEDLARLLNLINRRFEINLDPEIVVQQFSEAGATVAELAKLIHDEYELG
jgi:acyl carrier protein